MGGAHGGRDPRAGGDRGRGQRGREGLADRPVRGDGDHDGVRGHAHVSDAAGAAIHGPDFVERGRGPGRR